MRMAAPMLDSKSIPKADTFNGKVEDWAEWKFGFKSYVTMLGLSIKMREAELNPEEPELIDMTTDAEQSAHLLYHLLVQLCKGKARNVARGTEEGNGFKLWRALLREYEPDAAGRHQGMLGGLLAPTSWANLNKHDFESKFIEWEQAIVEYERQSHKRFDDDNKVAVVLKWAPAELKASLLSGHPGNRANFVALRSALMLLIKGDIEYDASGLPVQAQPAGKRGGHAHRRDDDAMQVDAMHWQPHHNQHNPKGKWQKGHGKSKDSGKKGGKNKHTKNKSQPQRKAFDGYCNYCGKYGHKEEDCWLKQKGKGKSKSSKGKDKSQVSQVEQQPESEPQAAVKQVQATGMDVDNGWCMAVRHTGDIAETGSEEFSPVSPQSPPEGYDTDLRVGPEHPRAPTTLGRVTFNDADSSASDGSMEPFVEIAKVRAAHTLSRGDEIWILWDTGSDEHMTDNSVTHLGTAGPGAKIGVADCQGNPIETAGSCKLDFLFKDQNGNNHDSTSVFQVGGVNETILSAGKVVRSNNFRCVLDFDNSFLEHKQSGARIPLYLRRNSFYLKGQVSKISRLLSHQVAPAAQSPAWRQPYKKVRDIQTLWEYPEQQADMEDVAANMPPPGGAAIPDGSQPVIPAEPWYPREVDVHDARLWPAGLNPGSTVTRMQQELKDRGRPSYGTKQQMWRRLVEDEAAARRERYVQEELQRQLDTRREGQAVPTGIPLPQVRQPTAAEREAHMLTHLPPAPWCEHCVMGRGTTAPHRRVEAEHKDQGRPLIEMDIYHMKSDGAYFEKGEVIVPEQIYATTLVMIDTGTGAMCSLAMPKKFEEDENARMYVVTYLQRWLGHFGFRDIEVRTDNEPMIVKLAEKLKQKRGEPTHLSETSTRSPQSIGTAERAVRSCKEQFRTLRFALEHRLGMKVTPEMPIWAWLARHAAFIITRFQTRATGQTAFQHLTDTQYRSQLGEFGEAVMFREATSDTGEQRDGRRPKGADSLWLKGVWIGRSEFNNEHMVISSVGARGTMTVRTLPPDAKWDRDLVLAAAGLPWQSKPRTDRIAGDARKPRAPLATPLGVEQPPPPPREPAAWRPQPEPARAERAAGDSSSADTNPTSSGSEVSGMPTSHSSQVPERGISADFGDSSSHSDERRPITVGGVEMPASSSGPASGVHTPTPAYTSSEGDMQVEQPLSPARLAWMESERSAWRQHVENQPEEKRPRVGAIRAGVTVDEEIEYDQGLGPQHFDEEHEFADDWARDAVHPEQFSEDEIHETRWKHITEVIDHHDMYDAIEESECDPTGQMLTGTWVEAIRDEVLKSRWCARDFNKNGKRTDLFAPGSQKDTGRLIDFKAVKRDYVTFTVDISAAYNTLPEQELVYCRPPKEWLSHRAKLGLSTTVVWRMKKLLPGRRVAATQWVEHMASVMMKFENLNRYVGAPQLFTCKKTDLSCELHMDDIHGTAPEEVAAEFMEFLKTQVPVKKATIHRVGDSYEFLRRKRTRYAEGMLISVNGKYIDKVIADMELDRQYLHNLKPAPTPSTKDLEPRPEDDDDPLDFESAKRYRSNACTLLYCSHDMADVQHAMRTVLTDLREPTVQSWRRLTRLARYMMTAAAGGVWIPREGEATHLKGKSDSDWAGNKRNRKSVHCTIVMCGGALLYSCVAGQAIHAQSSGEAEFYGTVSCISTCIGILGSLKFIGFYDMKLDIFTDSSAARGILARQGCGKVRHLEVKTLWVQSLVKSKFLRVLPIAGEFNEADIGTKCLPQARLEFLKKLCNIKDGSWHSEIDKGEGTRRSQCNAVKKQTIARQQAQAMMATVFASSFPQAVSAATDSAGAGVDSLKMLGVFSLILWAVYFCYLCWRSPSLRKMAAVMTGTSASRDVAAQSQVTYCRKWRNPRFVLLREGMHGVWIDYQPDRSLEVDYEVEIGSPVMSTDVDGFGNPVRVTKGKGKGPRRRRTPAAIADTGETPDHDPEPWSGVGRTLDMDVEVA